MNFFKNLKIKTKLILGFLFCVIVAVSTGYMGIFSINKIQAAASLSYEKVTVPITYLMDIAVHFQRIRVNSRDIVTANNPEKIKYYSDRINQLIAELSKSIESYEKTLVTKEDKEKFKDFTEKLVAYRDITFKIRDFALENKDSEAIELLQNLGLKTATEYQNAIDAMVNTKIEGAKKNNDENQSYAASMAYEMVLFIIIGSVLAMSFGFFISQSIAINILKMVAVSELIAKNDLTQNVEIDTKDELRELADSFNEMIASLKNIVAQVRESSEQLALASNEIAHGAQNVSEGAQNQSSTVEEISASVEELTSSINDIAGSAQKANEMATDTKKEANDGGMAVNTSVEAMKLINRSSEQISEIIGVISEIADQTNLLALNAAIEAARAGEHGMGFAVVADEVRKLAERSSTAAKEITNLIRESTTRVTEGMKLSEQAGEALKRILLGVEKTASAIEQISTATKEQSSTANEVAKAVENVASITEENAGASEEMASSAEELTGQAESLKMLVESFKIGKVDRADLKFNNVPVTHETKITKTPLKKIKK